MKLSLTQVLQLLKLAPEIAGLAENITALVHSPHVTVQDSAGNPVSPTVIADLVSVATENAVKGVQAAG